MMGAEIMLLLQRVLTAVVEWWSIVMIKSDLLGYFFVGIFLTMVVRYLIMPLIKDDSRKAGDD